MAILDIMGVDGYALLDIANLLAFLHALTDAAAHDLRGDLPASVPSGDPLAD